MNKTIATLEVQMKVCNEVIALCKANCATNFARIEYFRSRKNQLLVDFYEGSFDMSAGELAMYRKMLKMITEDLTVLKMAEYHHVNG